MSTLDRIVALIAVIAMGAFLLTIVGFVGHIDLAIVCIVGILLAAYDFYRQSRQSE